MTTKAPYEVQSLDIVNFLIKNQSELFLALPHKLTDRNIHINSFLIVDSTTINVDFNIPIFSEGMVINHDYFISIIDLSNKDTKLSTYVEEEGISVIGTSLVRRI